MSHKYPVQKLRRILLCRSYIALLPGERERRIIMKNYQVIKRSGSITAFDLHKISAAIEKAFCARNRQYDSSVIDLLTLRVTADFEPKIKEGRISVEDIQDSVETVLSQSGYADVAKAYILYRRQREKLRNTEATLLDYKQVVDNYLKVND